MRGDRFRGEALKREGTGTDELGWFHTVMPPGGMSALVWRAQLEEAAQRLSGIVVATPVVTSQRLDELVGAEVFLKVESLQTTRSFKFRGAMNKLLSISDIELRRGVGCASSGNHAQAVACAALRLGTHAVALMPADAPMVKVAAVRTYGAEVVRYDRVHDNRDRLLDELCRTRGLVKVESSNDPVVIAGQSTVALELLLEAGPLDNLLAPFGGGGLLAGSALTVERLNLATRVVGVELADRRSLSIADALRLPTAYRVPMAVCARLLGADDLVGVTDSEIVSAMRFLLQRTDIVAEPGGAAGLAAVLSGRLGPDLGRVGVIVSGGNAEPSLLKELSRE